MDAKYIKQFSFCYFCGSKYAETDFNQAEVSFKCSNCGQTNFLAMKVSTVGIIPATEDLHKVLLLKRLDEPGKGLFNLPGGFLIYGEDPQAGAKRELREELGQEVRITRLVTSLIEDYAYKGFLWKVVNLFYLCSPLESDPVLNSESSEFTYATAEEVLAEKIKLVFESEIEVIKQYAARLSFTNNRRRSRGDHGRDLSR
jgi:ADP-ribose pyrophosphatase YjhB (NUDIX family)